MLSYMRNLSLLFLLFIHLSNYIKPRTLLCSKTKTKNVVFIRRISLIYEMLEYLQITRDTKLCPYLNFNLQLEPIYILKNAPKHRYPSFQKRSIKFMYFSSIFKHFSVNL